MPRKVPPFPTRRGSSPAPLPRREKPSSADRDMERPAAADADADFLGTNEGRTAKASAPLSIPTAKAAKRRYEARIVAVIQTSIAQVVVSTQEGALPQFWSAQLPASSEF
mmetsp:Transcript_8232/g.24715  ORF Transcript_8232/g.24715 Transcript_8232/m.24715 type:complete len:110 (-) Transcript_8232:212-541(-)